MLFPLLERESIWLWPQIHNWVRATILEFPQQQLSPLIDATYQRFLSSFFVGHVELQSMMGTHASFA